MAGSKQIGLITALSLVMGIVIGGGILVLPSAVAQYGRWGFWAWPIASIAVLNLAFMFGFLSKKNPQASGPASYAHRYFGNAFGFQTAWAHAIGLSMGTAVIAISLSGYLTQLLDCDQSYGLYISLFAMWFILGLKALFTLISLRALVIITMIKIVALSMIILFGVTSVDFNILSAPVVGETADGFAGLCGALGLVLFAFVGIEAATLPGENVKNAAKTIPLATVLGTILSAVIFIGTYTIVWSVVPTDVLVKSNAPVANAALILMGPFGVKLISILAVIGCVGSINGCIFATSHILRSSALSGWLPKVFEKMTPACFPMAGGVLSASVSSIVVVAYYCVPQEMSTMVRNHAAQLEVFLISLVYLISCMGYKLAGGNKLAWILGVISCLGFLFGAMSDYTSALLGTMTFFTAIVIYTAFAHKMKQDI